MNAVNIILSIKNCLKGRKTYILAVIAIVYGVAYKDASVLTVGLIACGLRAGMANEIATVVTTK